MRILTYTLAFFFACQLIGQGSGIKGLLSDKSTGEGLIGATVSSGESGTITDFNGEYELELAPGTHSVTISYVGFESLTQEVTVANGSYTDLSLSMGEANMLLETAVITGSKYERPISESSVSISVLKPDRIESTNTSDVTSIIDKTPGVQMIDGQANIRGGSGFAYGAGSRVMLLVDDIPALQVDAGRPNWGDIPVENISQIEIIKGASSVLYGSSALNGIINVRTAYATSEPETKVALAHTFIMPPSDVKKHWWKDTHAPYRSNISLFHKQKFGKLDVIAHTFYDRNEQVHRSAETEEHMFGSKLRFGVNTKYRITDRMTVGLSGLITKNKSESPFLWKNPTSGGYDHFNAAFSKGENFRWYLDPEFTMFDSKGNKHKVFGRVYFLENDNNNNQSNKSTTNYGEYQFLREFEKLGIAVTAGFASTYTSSDSELFGDTLFTSRNVGIYGQMEKRLGEKLILTVGGRMEQNVQKNPRIFQGDTLDTKSSESRFIGRFGMSYEAAEYTFIRASIGQGYRFPSIAERFITTSFGQINIFPNPSLTSETGWSTEIGIKQGFKLFGFNGFLDLAAFWSQYDDMMEFAFTDEAGALGLQAQNVGDIDIKGGEINIVGQTKIGKVPLSILAGYTFINPIYRNLENIEGLSTEKILASDPDSPTGFSLVDGEIDNVLKYRSRHNIKGDLETGYKNYKFGATLASVSRQENVDLLLASIASIREYRTFQDPDGWVTLDLRLSGQFKMFNSKDKSGLKVSVVAKNVLNEEYVVRPGVFEVPRNISARIDLTF